MSVKKQVDQVQCPPPTEIDCISVTKVFHQCFRNDNAEMQIPFEAPTLEIITADAQVAQCVSSEVSGMDCFPVDEDHVRMIFDLEVTARVPLDEGGYETSSSTETLTRLLAMSGVGKEELDLQCEVFPRCIHCFISERDELGNVTEVTCMMDMCMMMRTSAPVNLLVPTYGVCQPSPCSIIPSACPVLPPENCQ